MSGGHFDYKQYDIDHIADSLEDELYVKEEDEFGYRRVGHAVDDPDNETKDIRRMRKHVIAGVELLRMASAVAHRFDWYISGDDGEDSFYERLEHDLKRRGLWGLWVEFLQKVDEDLPRLPTNDS